LQELGLALAAAGYLAPGVGDVPPVAPHDQQWAAGLPLLQCCLISQQCSPACHQPLFASVYFNSKAAEVLLDQPAVLPCMSPAPLCIRLFQLRSCSSAA